MVAPITRQRAFTHCRRQDRVRKNCKYLSPDSHWKKFKAGWDAGAFKEDGRTLYITCDGSSTPAEWVSNLRVFTTNGFHKGFYRAAVRGYRDLKTKLKHPIKYYKRVEWDCHSRGVFGLIMALLFWADSCMLAWERVPFWKLLIEYQKNQRMYDEESPKQVAVVSGVPVFCDVVIATQLKSVLDNVVTVHSLKTEKDFVPDINVPKGGLLSRLLKGRRLYHLESRVYQLGTARHEIDHLGYEQAIDGAPDTMWA